MFPTIEQFDNLVVQVQSLQEQVKTFLELERIELSALVAKVKTSLWTGGTDKTPCELVMSDIKGHQRAIVSGNGTVSVHDALGHLTAGMDGTAGDVFIMVNGVKISLKEVAAALKDLKNKFDNHVHSLNGGLAIDQAESTDSENVYWITYSTDTQSNQGPLGEVSKPFQG